MKNLAELRDEITSLDEQILQTFAKRFAVVQEVGEYKKQHNLPVQDKQREEALLQKLTTKGQELGFSSDFIHTVWQAIFQEAYRKEATI